MLAKGLKVDRPTIPISLEILDDDSKLKNPEAYPIKVRYAARMGIMAALTGAIGDAEALRQRRRWQRSGACQVRNWK